MESTTTGDEKTPQQEEDKFLLSAKYCSNCLCESCNRVGHLYQSIDPNKIDDMRCEKHQKDEGRYVTFDSKLSAQQDASDHLMQKLKERLSDENILDAQVVEQDERRMLVWLVPPNATHEGVLEPWMINELICAYENEKTEGGEEEEAEVEEEIPRTVKKLDEWTVAELAACLRENNLADVAEIFEENTIDGEAASGMEDSDFKDLIEKGGPRIKARKLIREIKDKESNAASKPLKENGKESRFLHCNIGGTYDKEGKIDVDPWNVEQIMLDDKSNIAYFENLARNVHTNDKTSLFLVTSGVAPLYPSDRDVLDAWQGSRDDQHLHLRMSVYQDQKQLAANLLLKANNMKIDD